MKSLVIYLLLLSLGLGICGWQAVEHHRLSHRSEQELIYRGRDITSTLGIVVRSQRRFGMVISKERFESSLQEIIKRNPVRSISILSADGFPIVAAGEPAEQAPEQPVIHGAFLRDDLMVLVNPVDLGTSSDDPVHSRPVIVINEKQSRAFRPPSGWRPSNRDQQKLQTPPPDSDIPPPEEGAQKPEKHGQASENVARFAPPQPTPHTAASPSDSQPQPSPLHPPKVSSSPAATATQSPPPFGRPPWMSESEYDDVLRKQGMHTIVIKLSASEMQRTIREDLVLRTLLSTFALVACVLSAFAFRSFSRNAELQLRLVKATQANSHLKEMNLAAAGLAHETRNPLNLIRGFAHMISLNAASDKQREHATAIMEEADRVTVQLNDFINYSKPREAHPSAVSVHTVAADIVRALTPDTEEKGVLIDIPDATASHIQADEQLLRQALFNLMLNAVQAVGQNGRISLSIQKLDTGLHRLELSDNGPGVPPEARENIFRPYVTMRPKGVGLGLAIVRQICDAHGWRISCTTASPKGACFRIDDIR